MTNKEQVLLFSLTSCEELTNKVAKELGLKRSSATLRRFADNEIFARPDVDVKNKDCLIIHSTCNPVNDRLMELLIFIDALKERKRNQLPQSFLIMAMCAKIALSISVTQLARS